MVAAAGIYGTGRGSRWFGYLLLSVGVNVLLVSAVTFDLPSTPGVEVPLLRVSLSTKARAATPPPVAVAEPPAPAVPVAEAAPIPIETVHTAHEKIAAPVAAVPVPHRKPDLTARSKPERPSVETPPEAALPTESDEPRNAETQSTAKTEPARQPAATPSNTKLAAVAAGDTGLDESTVIHEARYRHQTPPVYPPRALDLGQQGTVTLHAQVMTDGNPGALKVARSSGHRLLDLAALAAVRKWKFEPTTVDGTTTDSWVRVSVNFVIQ